MQSGATAYGVRPLVVLVVFVGVLRQVVGSRCPHESGQDVVSAIVRLLMSHLVVLKWIQMLVNSHCPGEPGQLLVFRLTQLIVNNLRIRRDGEN